ncbi:MAG: serine/threonine protein kinase [Planctomycetes bacterium]|nr:serine/threonine protein kinase [Planctomycetota bacterium]
MKPTSADDFAHLVGELELAPAAEVHDALREVGGGAAAESLGQALVRRELLTGFQLVRLLKGERRGYLYGRAKLLYQIGAGSFARVYRAIHCDSGGILAVKVLRQRFLNDSDKCRAFRHEGEVGQLLRHPNIVAIDDVGQENGASYITMEFVEGQTLRELVKIRGAIDMPTALDLIRQMAAGLEYAHRRGVTHRDLKASNVIVSSAGEAKLVDFGLAGVDELGDYGLGRIDQPRTIDYATLEKLTGMKNDAIRSDIYFLGTVAYLAVAGKPALTETRDRNGRANPQRYRNAVPLAERRPDLPQDVNEFVSRMMSLDPLERWQTAADVRRKAESLIAKRNGAEAEESAADAGSVQKGSLMVVESGEKAQRVLREFFGKLGYRVLLTENPRRALSRFSSAPLPADCLVLSTHTLGAEAVEAFNDLSSDPFLAAVPAVLLLGSQQAGYADAARADQRRLVVRMPVPTDEMGRILGSLVGGRD